MDKDEELRYIAKHTEGYLQVRGKNLEERLNQTHLDQNEIDEIKKGKGLKLIKEKGLSLFGNVGEAISTIINWNEEVNQEINEAKKAYLIEKYLNKIDSQDQAILMLKEFVTNPQGNTLFNKMLRIIDDSPPDEELIEHLSSVLLYIISNENFESLFEHHKYALAQIERLTPQALTIITDKNNWPPIELGYMSSTGSKVTSDWYSEFTNAYCKEKGISNQQSYKRVMHSVIELQKNGFIEAHRGKDSITYCNLTQIGIDIEQYLRS